MSARALIHAVRLRGLTPPEKVALVQIADHHDDATARAAVQIPTLCAETGLPSGQLCAALRGLESKGVLSFDADGIRLTALQPPPDAAPIPEDWRPSPHALAALRARFPDHHFDPDEAARDFIAFARSRRLRYAPRERDAAFIDNIAALLAHREPGQIQIGPRPKAGAPASLYRFLAESD